MSSINDNENPKTFLKITFNDEVIEDKTSLREGIYPEYYTSYEFVLLEFPGTGILKIEIMEE